MKTILFGFLVLASCSLFAGTPDQDPVIKTIMERFSKAGKPSAERLLINTYKCFDYSAGRDRFNRGAEFQYLNFSKVDGYLTSQGYPTETYFYNEYKDEFIADYLFVRIPLWIAIREEADGTLIIEEGAREKNGTYYRQFGLTGLEVKAISSHVGYVFQYDICIPK